jgi:hypothetical protein
MVQYGIVCFIYGIVCFDRRGWYGVEYDEI